jgi:PAS domain S-box-containing protein
MVHAPRNGTSFERATQRGMCSTRQRKRSRRRADAARPRVDLDAMRLREMLESLREGIQILAPDWRYLYVNEAVANHGRKRREELLGRTLLECYPGIERTEVFSVLDRCMRERCSTHLENEFVFEDDQHAWFELRIHPCREGLIVLSLDITERKRLEAALLQGQKLRALGQMAAGVAHDLRNILSPLGLLLPVLERTDAQDQHVVEAIELMRTGLERGKQTIDRLREFSRQTPEASSSEPIDVDAIVREAVRLCRTRTRESLVPIAIEEALAANALVRVNGGELLSAIINLIVNAVDAMPNGGEIQLASGSDDRGVWIDVHDTGAGMSADVQKRAFEPFYTTKGDKGVGLGLAMVYAFVARHEGEVRLMSAPGHGTRVTLVLPHDSTVDAGRSSNVAN